MDGWMMENITIFGRNYTALISMFHYSIRLQAKHDKCVKVEIEWIELDITCAGVLCALSSAFICWRTLSIVISNCTNSYDRHFHGNGQKLACVSVCARASVFIVLRIEMK